MKPVPLSFHPAHLTALLFILFAAPALTHAAEYLEEKTAFCYSKKALSSYLWLAQSLNTDGLNNLVTDGKCAFIADGEYLPLAGYKTDEIASVPIIIVDVNGLTLWTAKAFIAEGIPKESKISRPVLKKSGEIQMR